MRSRHVRKLVTLVTPLAVAGWMGFGVPPSLASMATDPVETSEHAAPSSEAATPGEAVAPQVASDQEGDAAPDSMVAGSSGETSQSADMAAPPAEVETEGGLLPDEVETPAPAGLDVPGDGIRRSPDVVGRVVGHPTGKILLAVHDSVTLQIEPSVDARPHDRFAIARREQHVRNPASGRNMGYVVDVVGTAELRKAFGKYWSAEIVSSTDYVTVDDWLLPFESVEKPTEGAASGVTGHIVAVQDDLTLAAVPTVVYTDLGSDQGVTSGQQFAIIRPASRGRYGEPDRTVGRLRILAVQGDSSSAYLAYTTESVLVGDRLERLP